MISTGSPGTICRSKNTKVPTPQTTGISWSVRRARKRPMLVSLFQSLFRCFFIADFHLSSGGGKVDETSFATFGDPPFLHFSVECNRGLAAGSGADLLFGDADFYGTFFHFYIHVAAV